MARTLAPVRSSNQYLSTSEHEVWRVEEASFKLLHAGPQGLGETKLPVPHQTWTIPRASTKLEQRSGPSSEGGWVNLQPAGQTCLQICGPTPWARHTTPYSAKEIRRKGLVVGSYSILSLSRLALTYVFMKSFEHLFICRWFLGIQRIGKSPHTGQHIVWCNAEIGWKNPHREAQKELEHHSTWPGMRFVCHRYQPWSLTVMVLDMGEGPSFLFLGFCLFVCFKVNL